MRLLLLLSALLTAITGAMGSTAASAQPVVASVGTAQAKPGAAASNVAPRPAQLQRAVAAPGSRHAPAPLAARSAGRSFGERRRE